MSGFTVRRLDTLTSREFGGLCEVLIDCVEGGASVSFMHPMTLAKAADFWRERRRERGARRTCAASSRKTSRSHHRHRAGRCGRQPENQPHRADIAKMLVHRRARRLGVGAAVLELPRTPRASPGRTLLVLDTASNDAERLYERCGWQRVGTIPDFALMPDGARCATVVYYKRLD